MFKDFKILKFIIAFLFAGQLLVGRFYDDRLIFWGIDFSIILFSIFVIIYLYGLSRYKKLYFILPVWLLLALLGYTCFSFLFRNIFIDNFTNEYGVVKFVEVFFFVYLIALYVLLTQDIVFIRYLAFAIFILASMVLLGGFLKAILSGFSAENSSRLSILGGGPIVFSRWLLTGVLYILFIQKKNILFRISFIFISVLLVFMSGSKGPIVAFAFAFIFVMLLGLELKKLIQFGKITVIMIFLIIVVIQTPSLNKFVPVRIMQLVQMDQLMSASSTTSRTERYPVTIKIVQENPLGVGSGNWAYHHNRFADTRLRLTDYPHNILLEISSEWGLICFFIFSLLIILILYRIFSFYLIYPKKDLVDELNFWIAFFVFTFINSNISGDLSDSRMLFVSIASVLVLSNYENLDRSNWRALTFK